MRRSPTRRVILALVWLGVAPIGPLLAPRASADEEKETAKVFVGYLYGPPRDVNFSLYTHLNHAFVTANADGKLNPGRGVPDRDLATRAHEAGVKVLVSLGGGGGEESFVAIVANPDAEARYVDSVAKLVDEYDYDGVDLDWEYPDTAEEVQGFERLVRGLRSRLDAIGKAKNRPMLVTMAASANPRTVDHLNPEFLVENLDWVNVMTYDYAGPWTDRAGHNAPLFGSSKWGVKNPLSIELSMTHLIEKRGMPADRLALGLPLYGRGFDAAEPYAPTKKRARSRFPSPSYQAIADLLKQGWSRTWDDETKTPWLISPNQSAVIGYDDAESIRLKTEWALSKGFRGVFFWQINGDRLPDGSNPLQAAARQAWDAAHRDRSR